MVKLYDKETATFIGMLTDTQLQFLTEQLEEESAEDTDYYFNRTTLDALEQSGADADLMRVLRQALGEREEMEFQWSKT